MAKRSESEAELYCMEGMMESICPYYSRCKKKESNILVIDYEIHNPQEVRNFALWEITPKSKVWIAETDGVSKLFACNREDSPCYHEILEKQITGRFRKEASQKIRDLSRKLSKRISGDLRELERSFEGGG